MYAFVCALATDPQGACHSYSGSQLPCPIGRLSYCVGAAGGRVTVRNACSGETPNGIWPVTFKP